MEGPVLRIACFSDTHGQAFGVPSCDLLMHAGDVHDRLVAERGGPLRSETRAWLDNLDAIRECATTQPSFVVKGNHDVADPSGFFATARDVSSSAVELPDGLFLIGCGWAGERFYDLPRPQDLARQLGMALRMSLRIVPHGAPVIMLSHYPATLDHATGEEMSRERKLQELGFYYDCVAEALQATRPIALIQGHAHRASGQKFWYKHDGGGRTLVLFPGPAGMMLDVDVATRTAEASALP